MTFNYDEKDDFDEADEFDEIDEYEETDDLEPEPEDDFLDEEDEPNTALSMAFRKASASEIDDEDEDDDADDEDDLDDEDDHEIPDEQPSIKPIELIPDEDDTDDETEEEDEVDEEDDEADEEESDVEDEDEIELPTLELPPVRPVIEQFRPQEQSNAAYADAVTAYYVEKNYQRAIEKFDEAIAYEAQHTEDNANDPNAIVAKSKYWQAEAYAKLHDLSQAVGIFEDLVETCKGHYLVLAARRRADQLNIGNA